MGERLKGVAHERMRVVIQERLQTMPDVPLCHCGCEAWRHELEAELNAGEVVILVQGHSPNTWHGKCSSYTPDKDGFDGVLQDVTRGVQEGVKGLFSF